MENNTELKVIILDSSSIDMIEVPNVKIVRIKSDKYNLLIMKDYWPVVGEINGSVIIEAQESIKYDKLEGFFALSHNIFHLIIKELGDNKNE